MIFIVSVLSFECFRRYGNNVRKYRRSIIYISNISFAVYFIHIIIMQYMYDKSMYIIDVVSNLELINFIFFVGTSLLLSVLVIKIFSRIKFIRKYFFALR